MREEDIIYNTARFNGIPKILARLLVAQSKHETNNFESNFFVKYNNAFGFSYKPDSRWQVKAGTLADNNFPIAVYYKIEDSVNEVIDWIKEKQEKGKFPKDLNDIETPLQYSTLLRNNGYYTDTLENYSRSLNKYFIALPTKIGIDIASLFILYGAAALAFYFLAR